MAASSLANAQYQNDLVDAANHTANLTLQWALSPEKLGDGSSNGVVRSGIGSNGKFYIVKTGDGVYIYDKTGQIGKIANSNTWVSINCDDAGHVYYRCDKGKGFSAVGGAYNSSDAQFNVIDSKTDKQIYTNVPFSGALGCRFDELPHIVGDMTKGMFEVPCVPSWTAKSIFDFVYASGISKAPIVEVSSLDPYYNSFEFPEKMNIEAGASTMSNAQIYYVDDEQYIAFYPNSEYETSYASNGWGNCIGQAKYVDPMEIEDEDEPVNFVFTGKFFRTINHSGVGGFCLFEYDGEEYIVYPSGQQEGSYPSADGFAVMKVELVDAPTNSTPVTAEQLKEPVAIKFGTEELGFSKNNWRGINVEPVEGQPGVFTIYLFSGGITMQVWTLDLNAEASGISDVEIDNYLAPTEYYNLQGVRIENPAEGGIYIRRQGTDVKKIIR